jgi:hypothetical protein
MNLVQKKEAGGGFPLLPSLFFQNRSKQVTSDFRSYLQMHRYLEVPEGTLIRYLLP